MIWAEIKHFQAFLHMLQNIAIAKNIATIETLFDGHITYPYLYVHKANQIFRGYTPNMLCCKSTQTHLII